MLHKQALDSFWRILKKALIKFPDNSKDINKISKRKNYEDVSIFRKKGFTVTEVIVAMGIVVLIAGVGGMSYLKYYDNAQLKKIELSALQFAKAIEVCSMKYFDDFKKCANSRRLKFNCDDCNSTIWYADDALVNLGERIRMEMEVDKYRASFIYRTKAKPNLAFRVKRTGQKFCGQQSYFSDGTLGYFVGSHPVKKCVNNSDCKSNICTDWALLNWGGGTFRVLP